MDEALKLPLLDGILPGGLRYGANYLVEFEPHSLWYETSLTLCAQALRLGVRTDYHTFTHPPADVRRQLGAMVLDLAKLEADDTFRIIDSYAVQTGLGPPERVGKAATIDYVDLTSVRMSDWDRKIADVIKGGLIPEVDRRRLHIDDDTSILAQFNDEKSVTEHFRRLTVPYVRRLELSAIHSVMAGVSSDAFYRQFESFCDVIVDLRARELSGKMVQSMRLRVARGVGHDSSWRELKLRENGEVVSAPGRLKQERMGPLEGLGENPPIDSSDGSVVSFLRERDEIDLDRYAVVGNYLRHDDRARNLLKDLRQSVLAAFESSSPKHENYLFWAPPGSGKTSFVRQLVANLGTAVRYSEVNLSEATETAFRRILADAARETGPSLCFIDEIDSRDKESWPLESLLASLDAESQGGRHVYILAGSLGTSLEDMKAHIESRAKGADVLSRIPHGNEYGLRGMDKLDNILVFLSSLQKEASRLGKRITEFDKFGLYYVAMSGEFTNARKLNEFAMRCAERAPGTDERLKYDNLFEPGDPANKNFWVSEGPRFPDLTESFLNLKHHDDSGHMEGERRLAAIMFTDMVGFTSIAQRDEDKAMRLLDQQRFLVRPLIAKHKGREVKTMGDAFLVEFASSLEAVRCAVEIQAAQRDSNRGRPAEEGISLRIGIHLGDVIHAGSDVYGDAVNVASRIEPLAPAGGICVSAQIYDSVVNKVEYEFDSMGTPELKNVSSLIEVYRILGFGEKVAERPSAKQRTPPSDRIAVLPFLNIAQSSEEYFADGMTEEIISSVSRTKGLRVIARTSVMKYKGTSKTISEIGRELGAGSVLEGSVRKSGDQVRITVQLVDTHDEEPKWSQEYDRRINDIFEIQSDVAQKVAEALRLQVLAGAAGGPKPTTNTQAYVDYLRGRQAWNSRTEEGLRQAIGFFERALDADGRYAKAYSGLADSYASLAFLEFAAPNEAYPKAKEAVGKALALDPSLVEAHTSLGLIRFQYDWDWEGAEKEFKEAIKLNPSYAQAHQYFADYLKAMGRFEEALAEVARAQELDPLNLSINTGVGHVLYLSRQFDKAIEQYKRTVDLDPNFTLTHIWFGRPYLEKGMYTEAISELETAVRLSGEGTLALSMLGHGLASAGRKDEALGILDKLAERSKVRYVPSYWIAVIYNGFRDKNQVLAWLRRAFEERSSWLVWSNVEPRFDWIRGDPEFKSLISAMRFP